MPRGLPCLLRQVCDRRAPAHGAPSPAHPKHDEPPDGDKTGHARRGLRRIRVRPVRAAAWCPAACGASVTSMRSSARWQQEVTYLPVMHLEREFWRAIAPAGPERPAYPRRVTRRSLGPRLQPGAPHPTPITAAPLHHHPTPGYCCFTSSASPRCSSSSASSSPARRPWPPPAAAPSAAPWTLASSTTTTSSRPGRTSSRAAAISTTAQAHWGLRSRESWTRSCHPTPTRS
jgi:hypothetical protein